jgi:hypothetical protein
MGLTFTLQRNKIDAQMEARAKADAAAYAAVRWLRCTRARTDR